VKISLANLYETPEKMQKVQVIERNGRRIKFSWEKATMAIYEVWMSDGGEFDMISE